MAEIQPQVPTQTAAAVEGISAPEPQATPDAISPKLAALAKKERWIRQQQQALQAEREKFKAESSKYDSGDYIPRSKLLENPWEVLGQSGLTVEGLIEQAKNQPSPQEQELRRIQAEIKSMKDAQTQAQDQQYQQALKQIRTDVGSLVNQDAERFELIKAYGLEDNVVKKIEEHFKETGTVLDLVEAATKIEDEVFEEMKKAVTLKKMKSLLTPQESVSEETQPEAAQSLQQAVQQAKKLQITPKNQQPIKTLTHAQTVVTAKPSNQLSRRERALLAFKGQLT